MILIDCPLINCPLIDFKQLCLINYVSSVFSLIIFKSILKVISHQRSMGGCTDSVLLLVVSILNTTLLLRLSYWILSRDFSVSAKIFMWFLSLNPCMCWFTFIDLYMLNQPCNSGENNLFMLCNWFAILFDICFCVCVSGFAIRSKKA